MISAPRCTTIVIDICPKHRKSVRKRRREKDVCLLFGPYLFPLFKFVGPKRRQTSFSLNWPHFDISQLELVALVTQIVAVVR